MSVPFSLQKKRVPPFLTSTQTSTFYSLTPKDESGPSFLSVGHLYSPTLFHLIKFFYHFKKLQRKKKKSFSLVSFTTLKIHCRLSSVCRDIDSWVHSNLLVTHRRGETLPRWRGLQQAPPFSSVISSGVTTDDPFAASGCVPTRICWGSSRPDGGQRRKGSEERKNQNRNWCFSSRVGITTEL